MRRNQKGTNRIKAVMNENYKEIEENEKKKIDGTAIASFFFLVPPTTPTQTQSCISEEEKKRDSD